MKKLLTLAIVATLLMAGSAFAQWGRHPVAQPNATFAFGTGTAATGPATTNNNDSCDIGVTPAATLLLPYFEVETSTRGVDTFFTITNTSRLPQIAHVVVWTDWSVPVLDFNVFLTGYDVQPLSMYDIIVNGIIAPVGDQTNGGTSSNPWVTRAGVDVSPIGRASAGYVNSDQTNNSNSGQNPNITSLSACVNSPGLIPPSLVSIIQNALIKGTSSCGSGGVGSAASTHTTTTTAVGYVTVDVAAVCSTAMPDNPNYFRNEILFDNVLIGDYQILNKTAGSNYAGGDPMVHIRAVPEGGPSNAPLTVAQTNLPYTFYSRFINNLTDTNSVTYNGSLLNYDRRQPLPAVFAARYIQGGPTSFNTSYRIWREGRTAGTATCGTSTATSNAYWNGQIAITEISRFDQHENPAVASSIPISGGTTPTVTLPETSNTSTSNANIYPQFSSTGVSPAGDNDGWMYLNLNSGQAPTTANTAVHTTWAAGGARASQNWVVVSMSGAGSTAGLFGVDFSAAWIYNGCTPPVAASGIWNGAPANAPYLGAHNGGLVCPTAQETGAALTQCTTNTLYNNPNTNTTP